MTVEILLALVASLFTASASVAQRAAAKPAPGELRFSWRLVVFLLRRPVWFLGVLFMVAGFFFQLAALHFGTLSLVEPVIASELLFVFAYLAIRHRGKVRARDWGAAAAMAASLGGFLFLADPSGGSVRRATAGMWVLAGVSVALAAAAVAAFSTVRLRGSGPASPAHRAASLSVSAGICWGFVAAVIKELSAHIAHGPYAVFTNWSPYVLVASGAVAMFVVSNAFQAGPLAASQPGLTIVEPFVASLIGITLFGDHVRSGVGELAGELAFAAVLVASVVVLSRSPMIATDESDESDESGDDGEAGGIPDQLPRPEGFRGRFEPQRKAPAALCVGDVPTRP